MKFVKIFTLITLFSICIIQTASAQYILSIKQQEKVDENVSNFMYDLNFSNRDKPTFKVIIQII